MRIKHLTPILGTLNLSRTIKFYRENLGFECLGIYPDNEEPSWVSLWNGDVEIAFSAQRKRLSLTGTIYLYVENVEEIWKILKNKVEVVYPLNEFDDRSREFAIRDNNGYVLNIGQNNE